MILGRNPALWLALIQATLNVLVVILHIPWDSTQIAVLNVFGVAVVGVVANNSDPTTAGTFALTTKAPASGIVTNKG